MLDHLQTHPRLALLASAFTLFYAVRAIQRRSGRRSLPPGPKGIPLFGNTFQLSTRAWHEYEAWGKEFGPMVYINVAGRGIVVFNTIESAAGFLDRRGHTCDGRPRLIVSCELLCGGLVIPFMNSGDRFKRMRRASHDAFTKTQVTEYHPIQMKQGMILADEMLRNPADWRNKISRAAASTILSIVYDLPEFLLLDDSIIDAMNDMPNAVVKAAMPGAYLVELFPWMMYIPSFLAKWKRDAQGRFKKYCNLFGGLFRDLEKRISEGESERPSFVGYLAQQRDDHKLSDLEAWWVAATLYAGGYETTNTTMVWFMLAMIAYPEKQKKCQEELDAVVGRSRMPTFKDWDNLPYLQATVREILRWRAALPMGVPHYTKEDSWYQGYFIPKDTICVANAWSINRDRAVYGEDADDFNPDRFIDEEGKLRPAVTDTRGEGHISFGFGPRLCLGRHVANNSLFIFIATILWATNITPAVDESGKPIVPDTFATAEPSTLTVRPAPFGCSITPRFPGADSIIAHARELL